MAAGRDRGGASRSGSNHPALACASAAPPCPRRGLFVVNCHVLVLSTQYFGSTTKPYCCRIARPSADNRNSTNCQQASGCWLRRSMHNV